MQYRKMSVHSLNQVKNVHGSFRKWKTSVSSILYKMKYVYKAYFVLPFNTKKHLAKYGNPW